MKQIHGNRWHLRALFGLVALAGGLLGPAAAAWAAFPGRNGKIAFDHNGDIYVMKPDGSHQRPLTPNGRRIAFEVLFGALAAFPEAST